MNRKECTYGHKFTSVTNMWILFFVLLHAVSCQRDLGIRFSKVSILPQFSNLPQIDQVDLPLTSKHYPIANSTYQWLRFSTGASVIPRDQCSNCSWTVESLIEYLGGPPSHPSGVTYSPYWYELLHVARMQKLRREGIDPKVIMPLPDAWKNFSIGEVAEAVHDEFLGIFHIELLSKWRRERSITMDANIVSSVSAVDFLRSIVLFGDVLMWAIARVGQVNFALKWHVGMARPEEVAFQIASGKIRTGPPKKLVRVIKALNLKNATEFTAYPEGSPTHPSWPGMHSASSAASLWVPVVMQLTPHQLCQVQLTDYAISYARTVAGVHYPADNIAGLKLGQEIVARLLPDFIHENYGTSKSVVEEKVKSMRFDWDTFLESDCAKGEIKNIAL
jgi:membrane-associated phospholipid phosphatase